MSTDTPRPERVTLTDEEVEALQDETGNSGHYVKGILAPAVERILAAREQARSEEIEKVEAERDALIALLRAHSRAAEHAYPYCLRCGGEDVTPRPERVTLSDEDVALLAEAARVGSDRGYDFTSLPDLVPAVERILAAREQARSEEIACYEAVAKEAAHWLALANEHPEHVVYSGAYTHTNILRRLVAARGESPKSLTPTRIITNAEEAALAREQGFAVPDHAEDAYPFTVTGQRSASVDQTEEAT